MWECIIYIVGLFNMCVTGIHRMKVCCRKMSLLCKAVSVGLYVYKLYVIMLYYLLVLYFAEYKYYVGNYNNITIDGVVRFLIKNIKYNYYNYYFIVTK